MNLVEKVLALHVGLRDVPHAFGGALALAYYAEPRATIDIDLNVFVTAAEVGRVTGPLDLLGVTAAADTDEVVSRDGQVRLWWGETPLDLFFSYDPFHEAARAGAHDVPFADSFIPILAAEHLVVCKAVFDRPKDWVDLNAMLADGTRPDVAECLRWVGRIVGDTDPRYNRLAATLST